jgi:hypothetical protein
VEIKIHPTHARNTKNIMVGLGIVTISCWAIGMVFGQNDQNQKLVDLCALFSIISGFGVIIISSLRAFLIQCPTCKKMLTKQVSVNKSIETRKFCCKKCNVIWDSNVTYEFGSD